MPKKKKIVFKLCPPWLLHFPHQRIQTHTHSENLTLWHCHNAPTPPSTPKCHTDCYNPEQVSVWQINGKTYGTGTIKQTSEIRDQLCHKKSVSACWQYDPGYRVNSPLDPCLYQFLNATHHLLNDTDPQLARGCWFCLTLGAPWYLATPVPSYNSHGNFYISTLTRASLKDNWGNSKGSRMLYKW